MTDFVLDQPKIWLDIDGVLADFGTHFLEYLNFADKSPAKDWEDPRFVRNFHKISDDKEFWLTIPPLVSVKDIPFKISGYCTSRSVPSEVTEEWLENNNFPIAPVFTTRRGESKSLYIPKDAIFIDDSIDNYIDLNKSNIVTFLMTRSHNERFSVSKRVNSLQEFPTVYSNFMYNVW